MKAEHRKELETNALADRMGRLLQGAKESPRRSTVWYLMFGIISAVAVFIVVRMVQTKSSDNSDAWYEYYVQNDKAVLESHGDQTQGKAVRFDRAGRGLWHAITHLGADSKGKISLLRQLAGEYKSLQEECEDDAVLASEAMYALAVIDETLAIEDRTNLDAAIDRYKELQKKHPETAYGKLAAERLLVLEDSERLAELRGIYLQLQNELRVERKK